MPKVMLFIDGTWLYQNVPRLAELYGSDFHLDFGKLPTVLAAKVGEYLSTTEINLVRTYLFGSYASNHDLRDDESVRRRLDFFNMLREEYYYEIETFPINFKGRRLKRTDRDPADPFEPEEKCVDIALATTMLYLATVPMAYDIGIVVTGDQDFKPALQYARRLGKRLAIASIKGSCSPDYYDPRDVSRVKDYDIIWLDDMLGELELKYEKRQLECVSPFHKGERRFWSDRRPPKGRPVYCPACRDELRRQREERPEEGGGYGPRAGEHREERGHGDNGPGFGAPSTPPRPPGEDGDVPGEGGVPGSPSDSGTVTAALVRGVVKKVFHDRGFGFIGMSEARDFYFSYRDVAEGFTFEIFEDGMEVEFHIRREARWGQRGNAVDVQPWSGA